MEQFFPSKLKNKFSDLPARSISSRPGKSVGELNSINNHPIASELIRVFNSYKHKPTAGFWFWVEKQQNQPHRDLNPSIIYMITMLCMQ